MSITYLEDRFLIDLEDKEKFFDFLVDCLNLVMPEKQKLTLRYRKFVAALALFHDEGYDMATHRDVFNVRMAEVIKRSKREWSKKDYDRYLSYIVVRGWVRREPNGSVTLPPMFNAREKGYNISHNLEVSFKTFVPQLAHATT